MLPTANGFLISASEPNFNNTHSALMAQGLHDAPCKKIIKFR